MVVVIIKNRKVTMFMVILEKRKKKISIKICERNICIAPKKAKALDKRYEDLLTKICLKHEVPAELEILSHIKGMVYTA